MGDSPEPKPSAIQCAGWARMKRALARMGGEAGAAGESANAVMGSHHAAGLASQFVSPCLRREHNAPGFAAGRNMMDALPTPARMEEITSQFYDGVLDENAWRGAFGALQVLLGGAMFHHMTMDESDGATREHFASFEAPQDKVQEYVLHHARSDERMGIARRLGVGQLMLDHEHFDAKAMSSSAIYSDWLKSIGLRHTLGIILHADGSCRDMIGFVRASADPAYGPHEQALCQALMPHLTRASTLHARMHQLARHAAIGLAAMDGLPQGIAVVDALGRIQYLNPAAAAVTADRRWCVQYGRLQLVDSQAQAHFLQLLQRACGAGGLTTGGALRLLDGGARVSVSVLPLKPRHALVQVLPQAPWALVVIADLGRAGVDPAMLGELLGLTPTEVRLALAVAAGKTVKNFAAAEGCSWHTARTHLRNLLAKSGCHRQVELVQWVQSLPWVTGPIS